MWNELIYGCIFSTVQDSSVNICIQVGNIVLSLKLKIVGYLKQIQYYIFLFVQVQDYKWQQKPKSILMSKRPHRSKKIKK